MENKGYPTPYGSTVIGGVPFERPNGTPASEHGPGKTAQPSEIAKLVDSFAERLIDVIADRVVELVRRRIFGEAPPSPETAPQLAPMPQVLPSGEMPRPQAPFIGGLGNATIPTVVQPLPADQVEAYAKAHRELEIELLKRVSVTLLRRSPEPPCWTVMRKDGVESEWTAYAASYDNPRFPVQADPGLYMVQADGLRVDLPHGYPLADSSPNGRNRWQSGLTLEQLLSTVDETIAS